MIPAIGLKAPPAEIQARLGLPKKIDGGSADGEGGYCLCWDVAPGYRLALAYSCSLGDEKVRYRLTEASITAGNSRGRLSDDYRLLFPYLRWDGPVYK